MPAVRLPREQTPEMVTHLKGCWGWEAKVPLQRLRGAKPEAPGSSVVVGTQHVALEELRGSLPSVNSGVWTSCRNASGTTSCCRVFIIVCVWVFRLFAVVAMVHW